MLRLTIILTIASFTLAGHLDVVYEWKYIDYDWKSKEQKKIALATGRYDYTQFETFDVDKAPDGRIFLTTPANRSNSVPATLSTVSEKKGPGGPLLKPYPNWQWHNPTNCTGMISVWKIAIDDCGRLWALDSGRILNTQICRPKLLVFDLKSDKLIQKIEIPDIIAHDPQTPGFGRLSTPVVETRGSNCEQTWVYMSTFSGGGIVIYDGTKLWRRDDDIFHPVPPPMNYTLLGVRLIPGTGLFGFALTPVNDETSFNSRRLFFRSASYVQQNSVHVKDLRDPAAVGKDIWSTTSKYRFPSALGAQAFSQGGILFYGMDTEIAIGCWNVNTLLNAKNVDIVAQDDETLQYASGVKVIKRSDNPNKEELWVTTNRVQRTMADDRNYNETNFRILCGSVDKLIEGTKCEL